MTSRNYLLLTPGPLTTSRTVKEAMLFDSCTWDDDYNLGVVQTIRQQLVQLATPTDGYTAVLLQGSGSYAVEAVLGSVIGEQGKVLIVSNGAYGARMIEMAQLMGIACHPYDCGEVSRPDAAAIEQILQNDPAITHIAMVHSETTTGMLNPIEEVAELAKRYDKRYIVDAMSSFGGIPLDIAALNIDYLISSANKCIQGVPGFAFVIAREAELAACKGRSRSLSLDLYAQWRCMEDNHGKWRFTSPTHTVLAFAQALKELAQPGIVLNAPQGVSISSPQAVRLSSGSASVGIVSQQNTDISALKRFTVAAGEAVSLLARKAGMKLFAAKGKIEIQAQDDALEATAKKVITVTSVEGRVEITAAEELVVNCAGAYIRLSGGNIELGCPGNILLKSANVQKMGAADYDANKPELPVGFSEFFTAKDEESGEILPFTRYRITTGEGKVFEGRTDAEGKTVAVYTALPDALHIELL